MSFRRINWGRDCLALDFKVKTKEQLHSSFQPGGIFYALPDVYKKYCYDYLTHEQQPVHWRLDPRRWVKDEETGEIRHVENRSIQVLYPLESHYGLWGGEGVVKGYVRMKKNARIWSSPRLWFPTLRREVFYSEILDKYLLITCTKRTLDLVDDCQGFDHYILKTHIVDLKSKLGVKLKRAMLEALLGKSFYLEDEDKRVKIYNRYKEYVKTAEEIECMGLSPHQALRQYIRSREQEIHESIRPLKDVYTEELIKRRREERIAGEDDKSRESWLNKLNPFKSSTL